MAKSRWWRAWIWAAVGLVVALAGCLLSTASLSRSVVGQRSTAAAANARLWNCFVPDDAVDVWYTSACFVTQVECTLSPASFAAWCGR